MLVGERRISRPKRVLYVAILIPLLGAASTAKEITGPSAGARWSPPWRPGTCRPNWCICNPDC